MDIDPRQLRYALRVAREGSFVKAAHSLHITQPALSVSIQRLERQLDVRLFERGRRGAKVTPEGEVLLQYASSIENILKRTQSDFRDLVRGSSAPLRIGGSPLSMMTAIPQAIAGLMRDVGLVSLEVREESDQLINEALIRHEIDLAVCTLNMVEPDPDIDDRELFQVNTVSVLVKPDHDLAGRKQLSLRELADRTFVLPPPGQAFRKHVEALFLVSGIDFPRSFIQAEPYSTLREILLATPAIGLSPWQIVKSELGTGLLVGIPLTEPTGHRTIGLRVHKRRLELPLVAQFCEQLAIASREFDDRFAGHGAGRSG